jgi:hypothetical protein
LIILIVREAPHYAVFSHLPSRPLSSDQIVESNLTFIVYYIYINQQYNISYCMHRNYLELLEGFQPNTQK